MMVAVVVVSVILLVIVAIRERRGWMVELQMAEASYRQAQYTREVAAIAIDEYAVAVSRQELAASAELDKATMEAAAARKGSDRDAIARAKEARMRAQRNLVIMASNMTKTIDALRADLKKAEAEELARKAERDRIRNAQYRFGW
jgi:hypothetical protein